MTIRKFGLKALSILWCILLLLSAVGLCVRLFSVLPGGPFLPVDVAAAVLCFMLAVFSFKESGTAFLVSIVVVVLACALAAWGLFVLRDNRYWPSVGLACFGVIYVVPNLFVHRYITRKTTVVLTASTLIAVASVLGTGTPN